MPLLKKDCLEKHAIFVGETYFSNDQDSVKLFIYMETPQFDEDKLIAKYGHLNKDKVNFTGDVKNFVLQLQRNDLLNHLSSNNDMIKFKLNGTDVELKNKEEVFVDA